MAEAEKQRFLNRTNGHIGANVLNEEGRKSAIAVPPGGTVELSEVEQRMTAQAPKDPANSPFADGTGPDGQGAALVPTDELRPIPADKPAEEPDGPAAKGKTRRPRRQSEDETGAAAEPAGQAAEGSYDSGEEVATPDAPKAKA